LQKQTHNSEDKSPKGVVLEKRRISLRFLKTLPHLREGISIKNYCTESGLPALPSMYGLQGLAGIAVGVL